MDAANIPVACRLSSAQLRKREASLIAEFKAGVTSVDDLPEGFRFELSGEEKSLTLVAKLVAAERECCPFLHFELRAAADRGPITLSITGPVGTKEFLRGLLVR
jgi:hypothetical protein